MTFWSQHQRHEPPKEELISWTALKLKTSVCERQCLKNDNMSHRLGEDICKEMYLIEDCHPNI